MCLTLIEVLRQLPPPKNHHRTKHWSIVGKYPLPQALPPSLLSRASPSAWVSEWVSACMHASSPPLISSLPRSLSLSPSFFLFLLLLLLLSPAARLPKLLIIIHASKQYATTFTPTSQLELLHLLHNQPEFRGLRWRGRRQGGKKQVAHDLRRASGLRMKILIKFTWDEPKYKSSAVKKGRGHRSV